MRVLVACSRVGRSGLLIAAMAAFGPGGAFAQTPVPKPVPQQAVEPAVAAPMETTATYGNWVLHCARPTPVGKDAAPAATSCEIVQTIQVQGQNEPLAKLAFGYPTLDTRELIATAVVPVNVTLPGRIGLSGNGKTGAEEVGAQDLAWSRCLAGACFARAVAEPGIIESARLEKSGALRFLDAQGQVMTIPLSWNGFAQALGALDKVVSEAAAGK